MKSKPFIFTLVITLLLSFTGVSISKAVCPMMKSSEAACNGNPCTKDYSKTSKLPSCCEKKTTFYKVSSDVPLKEPVKVTPILAASLLPENYLEVISQPSLLPVYDCSDSSPPELLIVQSTVLRI